MNAHAAPPSLPSPAVGGEAWARAVLERQVAMLDRLAEGEMEMAEAIRRLTVRQAEAAAQAEPAEAAASAIADLSRSHARVSRAMRLTLMLQAKLVQDLRALDDPEPKASGSRHRALRVVKRAAQAEIEDDDAVEQLVRQAAERLDREDICGDLLSRPTHEVIAFICRELDLDPDWPRLAQEAWEEAERNADPAKKKTPAEPVKYTVSWLDPQPDPARPQSASP